MNEEIRYLMLIELEHLINDKLGPYNLWAGGISTKRNKRKAHFKFIPDINLKNLKDLSIAKAYKLVIS